MLDGRRIVFLTLMDQSNVDEDVDLVELLLGLVGLIKCSTEVVQAFLRLSLLLRKEHAQIVVREERLGIDPQCSVVAL